MVVSRTQTTAVRGHAAGARKRRRAPAGITLLEVMIAVMILGIGLIGVGALVCVGALQAQRANIDDRKAILGQASVRDDKVRGFLQAENWLVPNQTSPGNFVQYMSTTGGVLQFPGPPKAPMPNSLQPVCIDPLMISAAMAAKKPFTTDVNYFANAPAPSNPPSAPLIAMQRLTVNANTVNWTTAIPASPPILQANPLLTAAQQSCMSEDDIKFTPSTTNSGDDALPLGVFDTAGMKREFVGQYSWLVTLVPVYGDLQPTESRNLMTMSVVVFNQREFAISPLSTNPQSERWFQVATSSYGSGYGGGDMTLTGSTAAGFNLRVGSCIMLGWDQADVPSDSTGKPTTTSGGSLYGANANKTTYPCRPMFRWYRILNVGPVTGSGGTWTQAITLSGADLNMNNVISGSLWAFVYDGAVAVYERTVRLEGPSMWTN